MFKIRDVIHEYIPVEDEDKGLLSCALIQRLRYIRQNDLGFLVFPTLNTSRFEHSLGVMHLAGKLADRVIQSSECEWGKYEEVLRPALSIEFRGANNIRGSFRRAARWYGMLHDIGHLPFSHLTETAIERAYKDDDVVGGLYGASDFEKLHEAAGWQIVQGDEEIQGALSVDGLACWMVTQLMGCKKVDPALQPLKDIVDSEVDADRIDATARDGFMSGGDFGHYDIERLIHSAQLCKYAGVYRVMFSTRAMGPVEGLLMERYKTHRWIHFHPKVMALKGAFQYCIRNLNTKLEDWHWKYYCCDESGFRDDAWLLQQLWTIPKDIRDKNPALSNARSAVLLRTETSSPLWKRTDEFHQLCSDVGNLKKHWRARNERCPIINLLFRKVSPKMMEKCLNTNAPNGVHYLVAPTKIKLIERMRKKNEEGRFDGYGEEHILTSRYHVVAGTESHRIPTPVPLSQQSGLVRSFDEVTIGEPLASVSVLGDLSGELNEGRRRDTRAHFVEITRQLLEVHLDSE